MKLIWCENKSRHKANFSAGFGQTNEQEPEFLQPLDNLTVTQGRDISFTCVVNNLGQYRVSFVVSRIMLMATLARLDI